MSSLSRNQESEVLPPCENTSYMDWYQQDSASVNQLISSCLDKKQEQKSLPIV